MSIARKIMSVFTLAIAIVALNNLATAQDNSANDDKKSVERSERKQRFGHEGKRGKHGRQGKRGMRGDRGLERMLYKLDLTDSQKSQIKTMRETQRLANQPMREEARNLMMKRRDGTITESEQTRLGDIHNEMKNSAEQSKNSMLALLTPEQTQKIEQMKAERKEKMEQHRQRRQEMKSETTIPTKEVG